METFNCQPLLDRLTLVMVRTGALREFTKRETTLEKIKYCLEAQVLYEADFRINIREEIQNLLEVLYDRCDGHGKCEKSAVEAKIKGSKAYMKKRDGEALSKYNECLRLAPPDSPTLPIAYANRSAVLVQMAKYEDALHDLDRAEVAGYPSSLQHKLLARRIKCHTALGQLEQAREALQRLKNMPLSPNIKEKVDKEVAELETALAAPVPAHSTPSQVHPTVPGMVGGENATVKYLTAAFEMGENEKFGRHVVAKEDVAPGSVIMVEKPFAVLLVPDLLTSHCLTCLSPAPLPLPCEGCRDVVYCSEECQREGASGCHRYECRLLHLLSSVGIAHLALRIIFIAGWDLHCQIRDEKIEAGKVVGTGPNGNYNEGKEGSYRAVYHLMPHLTSCSPEDQLQYCLASILLASAMADRTDFVTDKVEKTVDVAGLAAALMRHVAQLVSNAHAVTRVERIVNEAGNKVEEVQQKRVASAIYPTASLMNHSCKPNIINNFIGDLLVIRTIEDVKEGDQIYNCYGPHYCRQTREDRQESLKQQYFFTCKCYPCTQPQYMRQEAVWNGVQCESCGGVASWVGGDAEENEDAAEKDGFEERRSVLFCIHCHKLQGPSTFLTQACAKVSSLLESGEEALKKSATDRAVELLKGALGAGAGVYQRGNHTMTRVRDMLAAALVAHGDYERSCEELRECLKVTEDRYGSQSVELAHELLKFSDILNLAITKSGKGKRYEEELKTVQKRTDQIFRLNYGAEWKLYFGTE
ncbi:hypothetical protein Pcinc_033028 [Petrolisthes cinctipes]|uniref:Protein-lysine N-methyltransferase SMYD4 n=1 Tax=Petrolisthes cinctipes TaxID=88211 RepID=A0AAE1ET43_PETCI|nr:hypothetical protein Pcinc_033028 [Petrolisthes cinctipes]